MTEQKPKRQKRRQYIVDWRSQLAMTAQLLGVLFGVGLLYALGLLVLPGDGQMADLSSEEARSVFLRANAIYFALGAAILGVLSLLLTHRWAGPAFVLERVVQAMRRGDYSPRVKLRRRDYLQGLAVAIDEHRQEMAKKDEQLADLARCLEEGDVAAAKELCAEVRKKVEAAPAETAAAEQPAEPVAADA